MELLDQLVIGGLLAVIVVILGFALWGELVRAYHWRRALDRMEKTEWTRVLASLRTQGRE